MEEGFKHPEFLRDGGLGASSDAPADEKGNRRVSFSQRLQKRWFISEPSSLPSSKSSLDHAGRGLIQKSSDFNISAALEDFIDEDIPQKANAGSPLRLLQTAKIREQEERMRPKANMSVPGSETATGLAPQARDTIEKSGSNSTSSQPSSKEAWQQGLHCKEMLGTFLKIVQRLIRNYEVRFALDLLDHMLQTTLGDIELSVSQPCFRSEISTFLQHYKTRINQHENLFLVESSLNPKGQSFVPQMPAERPAHRRPPPRRLKSATRENPTTDNVAEPARTGTWPMDLPTDMFDSMTRLRSEGVDHSQKSKSEGKTKQKRQRSSTESITSRKAGAAPIDDTSISSSGLPDDEKRTHTWPSNTDTLVGNAHKNTERMFSWPKKIGASEGEGILDMASSESASSKRQFVDLGEARTALDQLQELLPASGTRTQSPITAPRIDTWPRQQGGNSNEGSQRTASFGTSLRSNEMTVDSLTSHSSNDNGKTSASSGKGGMSRVRTWPTDHRCDEEENSSAVSFEVTLEALKDEGAARFDGSVGTMATLL